MECRQWTKGLAFLLTLTMLMTLMLPVSAAGNKNDGRIVTGYCGAEENGENVSWTLNLDTGELIISGQGEMEHCSNVDGNYGPWYEDYRDDIVTVKVQEGVTNISTGAFTSFEYLTSVYIPSSVETIRADSGASMMFEGCKRLKEIIVNSNNMNYSSQDGVLFNKTMTSLLRYAPGNLQLKYVIPDGVTEIGQGAFEGATNLVRIEFPGTLKKIGSFAFERCKGLQAKIIFPDGLEEIGDSAFTVCKNITRVSVPKSLVACGRSMFYNAGLAEIYYKGTQEEWAAIASYFPESATVFFDQESGGSEPGIEEGNHQHALCAGTICTDPAHEEEHPMVSFSAWNEKHSLPRATGNYFLDDDVVLSENWTVPSGEKNAKIVLCLNGHSITCNKESAKYSICVDWDANLTICDCVGTGEITGPEKSTARAIENEGGQLSMYAGKVSGRFGLFNDSTAVLNLYGGSISGYDGIHNRYSTMTMYGGTVTARGSEDETVGLAVASGISSQRGEVEIYGGTVVGGVHNRLGNVKIFDGMFPYATIMNQSGSMEIHGGNFEQDPSEASCVYNNTEDELDSQLTIDGGIIHGKTSNISSLTIAGGVFQDIIDNSNGVIQLSGKPQIIAGIKTNVPITVADDEEHLLEVERVIPLLLKKEFELGEGKVVVKSASQSNLDQFILKDISDWKLNFDSTAQALYLTHKHTMTLVPATSATAVNPGNTAYYVCNSCNKWFSDEAGSMEIKDKTSVVIPATGNSGSSGGVFSGGASSSSNTVTVDNTIMGGVVKVSSKASSKGDTVTISATPDNGYVLEKLVVTDKDGKELTLTDKGDGKFSFVMPAGTVKVEASFTEETKAQGFADVSEDAYYYEPVQWALERGITDGISEDLFGPGQPCTRAQIVTFLWRAAGAPEPKGTSSFADVPAESYYSKAVAWAVENGITNGTGEGTFSPDAPCDRAQSVTFLFRALGGETEGGADFSDVPAGSYYASAVAWAAENGITTGTNNTTFSPNATCTRGQIATFLYRSYQGK